MMPLAETKPAPIQTLYDTIVKSLPPSERLKLAALILNDIPEQAVIDYSSEWSDEDLRDFSTASFNSFKISQHDSSGI